MCIINSSVFLCICLSKMTILFLDLCRERWRNCVVLFEDFLSWCTRQSTAIMASFNEETETLRLTVLGSHPVLPTIDSPSLYLTSLLVYSKATDAITSTISIQTLNPILNPIYPSLSSGNSQSQLELPLCSSHNKIKSYLLDLNPSLANDVIQNPFSISLQFIIENQLTPIIQHHFLGIDGNWKLASNLYARHLNFWNRSSLVASLRNHVENKLKKMGIWNLANHSKTQKRKSEQEIVDEKDKDWKEQKVPRSSDEIKERERKLKNKNRATTTDAFDTLKVSHLLRLPSF